MYNDELEIMMVYIKNCQIKKDTDVERLPRIVMRVYYCSYNYNSRLF